MKSIELHEMDVVLAASQPGPSAELVAELNSLLGSDRSAQLRHLMDGRPILVPGFLPGEGSITCEERNPRVQFLTGRVHQVPDTGVWTGPVLLESAEWRATYIAVESLAHRECSWCDPVWARAAAQPAGFWIEGFEIDTGVTAQIASQLGPEQRAQNLDST